MRPFSVPFGRVLGTAVSRTKEGILMRRLRTAVVIWVPFLMLVSDGPVIADTFRPASAGNWSTVNTWRQNEAAASRIPDLAHGDFVIIDQYDVVVDGENGAAWLGLHPNRTITVQPGQRLRIDGGADLAGQLDIDGGTFQVDGGSATVSQGGAIIMRGVDPVLRANASNGIVLAASASAILVSSDATICGTGSLRGDHPDASILINCADAESVTLTLDDATIRGSLTIMEGFGEGDAHFHNNGVVRADVPGYVLRLDASLEGITDTPCPCAKPRWRVDGNSAWMAVLSFERDALCLKGDFRVGGILEVTASDVSTGGELRLDKCGIIRPQIGGVFNAERACSKSSCTPQMPVTQEVACSCS